MNQSSFLLSGVSSSKASLGEGKAVLSPEVSESEGEGFFAQLAQLVSGDGETTDLASDVALAEGDAVSEEAISDVLLKSMAAGEGEAANSAAGEDADILALKGEILDAEGIPTETTDGKQTNSKVSEDAALALKSDQTKDNVDAPPIKQLAKQDGEALLARLNESNQALKSDANPAAKGTAALGDEANVVLEGKSLPSDADIKEMAKQAFLAEQGGKAVNRQNAGVEEEAVSQNKPMMMTENGQPVAIKPLVSDAEKAAQTGQIISEADVAPEMLGDELVVSQSGLDVVKAPADALTPEQVAAATPENLSVAERAALAAAMASTGSMAHNGATTPTLEGEVSPEMLAKTGVPFELLPKNQQEAMMRAQALTAQAAPLTTDGDTASLLTELGPRGVAAQSQVNMTQAASAVQAAVNPMAAQAQTPTAMSAFAAIPWAPAVQGEAQPQLMTGNPALDAATASTITETARPGSETKTDQFAQQLATSFGNQGSTTAARLDTTVAQTPLQMSQNQTEAANALSERVNVMLSKNLKHVDIRLDPPELGRMQIKLSMNQDQANVQFTVANQAARELVEQSMPRLREMMQQQGLQLSQSSVQQQDAGGRQSFAGNQTQQGDGQGGSGGKNDSSSIGRGDGDQEIERSSANHELYVNSSKDRVDYYA
ncbi:flagellar hook-length control protein FliK [Enterovibrio makurazakiensis]|uniref:flagellar hook-length control protein FliK n=1 Tax=Enterovibrio makurazakiensis TaxID=2910232 RepID=UPI003D216897